MSPRTKKTLPSHNELPASVGLLKAVRSELRAEIRKSHKGIDAKLAGHDARFLSIESEIQELKASSYRVEVLMEEQRNENKIVLDGLRTVLDKQARFEAEFRERFGPDA